MGSLPRDHAGVGSAINDTLRELGIALGVAVIGSIATSVYRSNLDGGLGDGGVALSATDLHTAHGSIGGALEVAGRSGSAGSSVASAARGAFVDGFHTGWWVAAAMMFASAVVALVFLPSRAGAAEPAEEVEEVEEIEEVAVDGVELEPVFDGRPAA
jgi:hypothetical protein